VHSSELEKRGPLLIRQIRRTAKNILERLNDHNPSFALANRLAAIERTSAVQTIPVQSHHLDATIAWIKKAQDASSTGGVCWGYRARRSVKTKVPVGWVEAYPETTGYIIPTLIRYAEIKGDGDSATRARRMAEWEVSIQLPDGGIQGGIYGMPNPSSSTFVTGQVLFGWVAAYRKWKDEAFRNAATRAAGYLLGCLNGEGQFVKGYSEYCEPGPKAYEVRTGLAMAEFGRYVSGEQRYLDAASRMADYAISCQQPNGWFEFDDLDNHTQPLTHTIGYTLEGLHGIGVILGREDCSRAVHRTLQAIITCLPPAGNLPGRFKRDWSPAVNWSCLTGASQLAGVFLRMHAQSPEQAYFEAGRKLLGFVAYTQELLTEATPMTGGIRGSYPLDGDYGQWCVLNWASKFFADSVMDYLSLI
jgi:hypothetical protein